MYSTCPSEWPHALCHLKSQFLPRCSAIMPQTLSWMSSSLASCPPCFTPQVMLLHLACPSLERPHCQQPFAITLLFPVPPHRIFSWALPIRLFVFASIFHDVCEWCCCPLETTRSAPAASPLFHPHLTQQWKGNNYS